MSQPIKSPYQKWNTEDATFFVKKHLGEEYYIDGQNKIVKNEKRNALNLPNTARTILHIEPIL
jgi:hypothetical protein